MIKAAEIARHFVASEFGDFSEITREVVEWIREQSGNEANLRQLMDAGFSENRLKQATEELHYSSLAEIKRGFGPTRIVLTGAA